MSQSSPSMAWARVSAATRPPDCRAAPIDALRQIAVFDRMPANDGHTSRDVLFVLPLCRAGMVVYLSARST